MKKTLFAFMTLAIAFAVASCHSDDASILQLNKTGKDTATINGATTYVRWVQLWANGPKFAEYNVGATSVSEYGGLYCWGKSADKDADGNWKNGTDAITDGDDTATKLWGSNWRMPTNAELKALLTNCTCTWTTQNSVNGLLCIGKDDYSENSVFLPAAGYCYYGYLGGQDGYGGYWSSTPEGSRHAFFLFFNSGGHGTESDGRSHGFSVRAVLAEQLEECIYLPTRRFALRIPVQTVADCHRSSEPQCALKP